MSDTILTLDGFENAVASYRYNPSPECWEWRDKLIAHDSAMRRQVEELTRERDELWKQVEQISGGNAKLDERVETLLAVVKFLETDRDALRARLDAMETPTPPAADADGTLHDRIHAPATKFRAARSVRVAAEAQHVCDNRCAGDAGHHAWPSPPAAEASGWWTIISQHNGRADCDKTLPAAIDAEVKRREAALRESVQRWTDDSARYCENADYWRERAERAEAEVARLRDPERERLISDVVDRFANDVWYAWDAVDALVLYERARAKEKP